jgi:enoyl-CoA hydratase/carnithine racemase
VSDTVLRETIGGVALVTLNRPDRLNALNPEIMAALLAALEAVAADPEIGCVVLTGAGRGFCAGQGIARMATLAAPAVSSRRPILSRAPAFVARRRPRGCCAKCPSRPSP